MKHTASILLFISLTFISLRGFTAQRVIHRKKHRHHHTQNHESRVQMQLRQGRLHTQQAKEADKVQQEVNKEQQ